MSIITIATDFGTADGFAAAMIGVIKSIVPQTEVVEVTHSLKGIVKTNLVIERYYSYYPRNTIHLVVVDPTVGSDRKALIGYTGDYFFVGPDNGIFGKAAARSRQCDWWAIDTSCLPSGPVSSTFHGRDIFAPAAALLATGKTPNELGVKLESVEIIDLPRPVVKPKMIEGEVIDIDNFGNLVTNIESGMFTTGMFVRFENGEKIPVVSTYSDVARGNPLGYTGSAGYLEIGVNMGRADLLFNADLGTKVMVML
ncbi:MAG: SAM-dependent chlorinase/fluorinase [Candidatus Zixiibacteriota bacterium]|nr:MAG: SAM-dependent chlorinase/fluorinase [candidate division Zixibacteria bacterium]